MSDEQKIQMSDKTQKVFGQALERCQAFTFYFPPKYPLAKKDDKAKCEDQQPEAFNLYNITFLWWQFGSASVDI